MNNVWKLVLIIVLIGISFAFVRASMYFIRYYKQLISPQSSFGIEYRENHPRWYIYLKFGMPIIIAGFILNAMAAAIMSCYVAVRWIFGF